LQLCNYGSAVDAGIFDKSDFKAMLDAGGLNLPEAANLPNSEIKAPYYFVWRCRVSSFEEHDEALSNIKFGSSKPYL